MPSDAKRPGDDVIRRGEHLLQELKARYEIDMAGMAAGVRARLEARLELTRLPIAPDLQRRRGRLGAGEVVTDAFSSARLRKVVLSEIRLWPVIEGFALTLLPRQGVAAPVFGADFMLLPSRLAANVELYGPPSIARGVLAPIQPALSRLPRRPGPPWAAAIASGEGMHARVSPRLVDELFAATTSALGLYLDALAVAPDRGAGATDDTHVFFDAFHANGPRRGPLRWIFGDAWAERYSHLMFE
jgi:hypothetical protein